MLSLNGMRRAIQSIVAEKSTVVTTLKIGGLPAPHSCASCSCHRRCDPCPCGYYGDPKRECRCGTAQVLRYRQRISGPLLDRIDIHVEVPLVEYRDLAKSEAGEPSSAIRARIEAARGIQQHRLRGSKAACNAMLTPKMMK